MSEEIGYANVVCNEKDLKLQPRIYLNPPPLDGRCECCGRHISELKPLGGIELPVDTYLVQYALLVRRFRLYGQPTNQGKRTVAVRVIDRRENNKNQDPLNDIRTYFAFLHDARPSYTHAEDRSGRIIPNPTSYIMPSWECRDCITLSNDEYWKKISTKRPTH